MNKLSIVGMIFIFLLMSASAFAYDTEIDGLRYDWNSYYNGSGTGGDVTLVGYSSSYLGESLTIPCSVKWNESKKGKEGRNCQVCTVASNAFENCTILKNVDFGCVKSVMSNAFKNSTSLQTIYFSNTIISILPLSFSGCTSLSEIHIDKKTPPNIYEENAFDDVVYKNCKVYVPEGCVDVYKNADIWKLFVNITDGTTNTATTSGSCGNNATWTYNASDNQLVISGTGKMYDYEYNTYPWYSYCNTIKTIVIENGITYIGKSSFNDCSSLISITIPNSVTSISVSAFNNCDALTSIISEIVKPFAISEDMFPDYTTPTLTVPSGTKSAYQATAGWNKFKNIVEKEADIIIQGDANGDSEVNVSDIVEVVNYIMNKTSSNFLKANADLNGDGEVNVTDIVMMVSIIMSGQTGSAHTISNRAGNMTDGDRLTIDDVTINAGETKQVSISLNNPDKKYTAFQFDLTLPEGITIAKNSNGKLMASLDTERKDDHTLNVSELGNNTYRFLAFSMSNAELYGTNDALVNITLEADANMDSGTNAAALKSQVFTATDGTQYKWSDLPFSILVIGSENTGIDEIPQNGQKGGIIKVYTLTGLLLFSIPQSDFSEKWQALPFGIYIVNGQKMIKSNNVQNKSIQ